MDQERTELLGEPSIIPAKWRWEKLGPLAGDELEFQYRHTLEALAKEKGETWIGIGVDVKSAIYEGLLERNAAEVKSGAGQYFTPRPLIDASPNARGVPAVTPCNELLARPRRSA